MIRAKQERSGPIVVDLTGPDGNAFALMGLANRLGKQLGFKEIPRIMEEMQAGDYEHLLEVFDGHFGDYVILER